MPINFKDVFYTYSPKTPFSYDALKGVNLTIKKHTFTAIVGHTGSGKSTLVQHLNALVIPTSGEVIVDDFTIGPKKRKNKNIKMLRKHVGLVFQFPEYQLFEDTVEKDVAFGPKNFKIKEDEALLKAHAALNAVGLNESYYRRSPFELSGGEKRRVAIAGIIALEPEILVLDEPTAGLDPKGLNEVMSLFEILFEKGTTIIIVTHDMDVVVKYATSVVLMKDGKIVSQTDTVSVLKENLEEYSLEVPPIFRFVKMLEDRGLDIDLTKVKDEVSLASEIKRVLKA